jgi:hypothetical protein
MMLNKVNSSYKLLAKGPPATQEQIDAAVTHFGTLPQEFIDLVREATDVELQHQNGQYVRIWGPVGCVDMDEANEIRKYIPESFPIGDDGGGHVIFYGKGDSGEGLYHVGFGNLGMEDAVWIANTLGCFLVHAKGVETF